MAPRILSRLFASLTLPLFRQKPKPEIQHETKPDLKRGKRLPEIGVNPNNVEYKILFSEFQDAVFKRLGHNGVLEPGEPELLRELVNRIPEEFMSGAASSANYKPIQELQGLLANSSLRRLNRFHSAINQERKEILNYQNELLCCTIISF